ncbi:AraC family transcriptional regulator [Chitinophaga filiformis]|uniref:helix-turn-helix domain-containing protein n=1 Tax=Chitinophaga filiformis TaxID=104663 RepID=UPI001F41652F|nr:AraC family transcriptional regulator [Chitinophaga filiformis]MCF6403042.1 AraC family transcriptional regulator [Chitinophaga filiformis]
MTTTTTSALEIKNPVDGSMGFRMIHFEDNSHFKELQRVGYFSIIWLTEGEGLLKADFTEYKISKGSMLFFAPGQPFMISGEQVKGVMMNFHHDFFCVIKHHKEVACDGILFNNINQTPLVNIPSNEAPVIWQLITQVENELQTAGLAQHDLLISYLKILLINVTRIKVAQHDVKPPVSEQNGESEALTQFKAYIDQHFREKHSAGEYAELLNMTVKNLGKIVRDYYGRTPTDMITERIIVEAKRELYLTSKPIKEIAYDLGFKDEYHFSRYFKNAINTAPQAYRNSLKKAWA